MRFTCHVARCRSSDVRGSVAADAPMQGAVRKRAQAEAADAMPRQSSANPLCSSRFDMISIDKAKQKSAIAPNAGKAQTCHAAALLTLMRANVLPRAAAMRERHAQPAVARYAAPITRRLRFSCQFFVIFLHGFFFFFHIFHGLPC